MHQISSQIRACCCGRERQHTSLPQISGAEGFQPEFVQLTWSPIISCSSVAMSELNLAQATSEHCQDTFITMLGQWSYHKSVKYVILRGSETREFWSEQYLNLPSRTHKIKIVKLRAISHDLRIERGRYFQNIEKQGTEGLRTLLQL